MTATTVLTGFAAGWSALHKRGLVFAAVADCETIAGGATAYDGHAKLIISRAILSWLNFVAGASSGSMARSDKSPSR